MDASMHHYLKQMLLFGEKNQIIAAASTFLQALDHPVSCLLAEIGTVTMTVSVEN